MALFAASARAGMFAAISLAPDDLPDGVAFAVGAPTKRGALFGQTEPWEPRIDNGYPNVVPPTDASPSWQLFYGDCARGCETQVLLYANSSDGFAWTKPRLGLFDLGSIGLAGGTANNVVVAGGGLGVYYDAAEPDASKRYKGFGPAAWDGGVARFEAGRWTGIGLADLATSPDGLRWTGAGAVDWPAPQRYDCHNNLFYDGPSGRYVATTREGFGGPVGRAVGVAASSTGFAFDAAVEPIETLAGNASAQLYSQVTFPWLNVYLGIVMVYDAESAAGRVHCRLAWAPEPRAGWRWVAGDAASAPDLVPLGDGGAFDSHVCFAAASPASWDGEERIYYMGGDGPHSGVRNSSFGVATLRADGYAGVRGDGAFALRPVLCENATLLITADVRPGGSLRVGAAVPGLGVDDAVPLEADATAAAAAYRGGASFAGLVGSSVALEVELVDATLYAVGWG